MDIDVVGLTLPKGEWGGQIECFSIPEKSKVFSHTVENQNEPLTSQKKFLSQKKMKFRELQVRRNFQVFWKIFAKLRLVVRIPPVNFQKFPRVSPRFQPVLEKSKKVLNPRKDYRRQKNPPKDRKNQNLGI